METVEKVRPLLKRHRVTVDEYHRLAQVGGLEPELRLELIDGEVIEMATIGTRHAAAVTRLSRLLQAALGDKALIRGQNPVRLDVYSEPEPDIAVVKPRDDFYADAHPTAADTLLIIEVADTSARYDREIKLPLYARHGIAEVWIVDLDAKLLRIFRKPRGDEYIDITALEAPGVTAIGALPGITVDLTGLLG